MDQRAFPGRLGEGGKQGIDRHIAAQGIEQLGKPRGGNVVRGDAGSHGVGGSKPLAGERRIGAGLARHARQQPRGADVRKKPDADFRHGELEFFSRDPVRSVDGNPDAAAHDDAVDQRDIGLGIMLDEGVERVFVAPERQRLGLPPGTAEVVERADVAAGRERPLAGAADDDAGASPH